MPKVKLSPTPDETTDDVARDYDDFCARWEERIRQIVFTCNKFQYDDVDDIVQDLMLEFYAKDGLGQFDPTKGTKFATWVHGFAAKRLLGKRDKATRRWWREGLSLNEVLAGEGDKDFLGEQETAPVDVSVEFIDTVLSVYRQLKKTPVTSVINDFPKLFSCIVQQIVFGIPETTVAVIGERQAALTGRHGVNRKALAYEMGISESGVGTMLARLAENPVVLDLFGRS